MLVCNSTNKSPDRVADAIGQLWVDYSARRAWIAVGIASVDDWLELSTPTTLRIHNSTTNTDQRVELQGAEAEAALVIGPS